MVESDLYLNKDQFENVFKKHIKTSVYSLSIKTLFGERFSRKIDYQPYYQRNYVWDDSKASFFIESILLGTDIPPLIFFMSGSSIEVIDGRQRYETIKKFREGELKLTLSGLTKLTQLKNHVFSKLDNGIRDILNEAKIRIFEFEVINEPKLDSSLEDKIKKEIFRRYNSGITPLNSAEIDNATYDDDDITNRLKELLVKDDILINQIASKFIGKGMLDVSASHPDILQFLRKYLVLSSFPINTYATGSNRSEIIDLLYNVKSNNAQNVNELCDYLISNLKITIRLINSFSEKSLSSNKFVNECLLWALCILIEEGINVDFISDKEKINQIEKMLLECEQHFTTENSHYYKSIITRHHSVARIFEGFTDFKFNLFFKDDNFKNTVKELRQNESEAKLKLEELSSLRVQKPEPSLIPVEEIVNDLNSKKYLVRPSYQRQEKINIYKAGAIIESIILGINLPPIFIFKNKDGVKEVIDGQQRLLSILGFVGKQYQDETGTLVFPKNCNYQLKRLKILRELDGQSYSSLDPSLKDKILDFRISVIEIDYALNNNFDPVDLFIRLNNKPYPIKENSFEMWNSFMDREIIKKIRLVTDANIEWFFIKQMDKNRHLDRMLNEELITLLSYISHNKKFRKEYKSIGFYLRDGKINCRISDKKDVSILLERMSTDLESKKFFLSTIDEVSGYIEILKSKLDPADIKSSLNSLFNKDSKLNKRYLVDFYMLFQIFQRHSTEKLIRISFEDLKDKMAKIQKELKKPTKQDVEQSYLDYFSALLDKV